MTDEKDTPQEEGQVAPAPEAPKEEAKEEAPAPVVAPAPVASDLETGSAEDGASFEVPKEFKKLVEEVENMSVMQLNELVKVLEKRFGVSAQAVAVAAGGGGDAGGAEEKSEFDVELISVGDSKIGVIKAVKAALGLGLKEAKEMAESAPVILKAGAKKEEAEELKKAIEEAGGKVTLK